MMRPRLKVLAQGIQRPENSRICVPIMAIIPGPRILAVIRTHCRKRPASPIRGHIAEHLKGCIAAETIWINGVHPIRAFRVLLKNSNAIDGEVFIFTGAGTSVSPCSISVITLFVYVDIYIRLLTNVCRFRPLRKTSPIIPFYASR